MKTLDEVIKRIEIYKNIFDKNGCFECHYHEDDCIDSCFLENVLYYLNTIETTENLYHNAVNELNKWIDNDWKDRCLPLTWDELKQMEGKPIWLEYDNHLSGRKQIKYKIWEVIDLIIEDMILVKGGFNYQKNEFGDVWQAYRKENNGR